jgi:hypothetical protein
MGYVGFLVWSMPLYTIHADITRILGLSPRPMDRRPDIRR